MANNHYDLVGQIKVKQLTPVIESLFRCYNLSENYPGNGVYALYNQEYFNHESPYWENFARHLQIFCDDFGIKIEQNPDASERYHQELLEKLFAHFGQTKHPRYDWFIQEAKISDQYDEVPLNFIYELARILDDGHGLYQYQVDAAWYCDKPRFGEFGGSSEFKSPRIHLYGSSNTNAQYGSLIDDALIAKQYGYAAELMATEVQQNIDDITDPMDRQGVANQMVRQLSDRYNPIPKEQPASNDAVENPYETPPKTMTGAEQRNHLANALAHIATDCYAQMPQMPSQQVAHRVVSEVIDLLEEGNFAYGVPPMQLVPVNPHQERYSGVVWRDGEGSVAADWNYNHPMPLVENGQALHNQFQEIYDNFAARKKEAAMRMFGNK